MKKSYPIQGLDCANCAARLENALARVPGVEAVRVNFMNKTFSLTAEDANYDAVLEVVIARAAKVEPEAEIVLDPNAAHKAEVHHEHHHHHDDDDDDCHCDEHHHHHHDDEDDDDDDDDDCHCGEHHHHHHEEKPLDLTSPVAAGNVRKTYPINGLDCANCAAKLENALAALPDVESVQVSFINKKVVLVCNAVKLESVKAAMTTTCSRVEPDAVIDFTEGTATPAATKTEKPAKEQPVILYRVAATLILALVAGLAIPTDQFLAKLIIYILAYLIVSYDVLLKAAKNISHGQIFDENFLMMVASIGAMAMQEYTEALAVMSLYQIGEWFQDKAVDKSRASIASLMDIRPDYANVLRHGKTVTVDPNEVAVGELIVIKPGEKIPLDGVVREGTSSLNTVALTGEALPRDVAAGDHVLSGCVNLSGVLTIEVTSVFGESTVAKILEMVESSGDNKAKAERFISKFARIYTPAVCGAAVLLAVIPPLFLGGSWTHWIEQALSFLVISCPCALVISVPLSFFSGIGGASSKGILIKGANYMEVLSQLDTVAFDKTGTLTKGTFTVTAIHPANGYSEESLLEKAAYAECFSDHPIAKSILEAYGRTPDRKLVRDAHEIAGHGIQAKVDGETISAGNDKLMHMVGCQAEACEIQGTMIHVAVEGNYMGHLVISDVVKPSSAEAMNELKATGVQRLVMLTGDRKVVAEQIASTLGLTEVKAELLPEDKVTAVESLLSEEHKVGFVGDGINDAPVLRRADLGIAMGAMGSDAAIEAADIVLMDDDPLKLASAIRIARRTMSIVHQNIVFALGVKIVVMLLGVLGIANMWLAVFADVGVCMLAILNAMRAMKVE